MNIIKSIFRRQLRSRSPDQGRFGAERPYPFDWCITPFGAVSEWFCSGSNILFDSANIDAGPGRLAVRCRATGVLHHHDFEREDEELVIEQKIADQLGALKAKYNALRTRLDEARSAGVKVIFVREWCNVLHYPNNASKYFGPGNFNFGELITAISARYSVLDFSVLFGKLWR